MQPRRGPPIHPSLPPNPQIYNNPAHVPQANHGVIPNQPTNIGALAAHALTSSLANPYGHTSSNHHASYTNANYHAYFSQVQSPGTTAHGYTLSSTYVPQATSSQLQTQPPPWPQAQRGRPQNPRVSNYVPRGFGENSFSAPGDTKCTHTGCSFTGSKKTVEIHMMDRHLIFPPGWKKRKTDWDADPSLKGKPVPIPGTGVTLNTPEAIDAWIAERRKKWPTNQRVEDRKRKAQEASNRGEIDPSELTAKGHKRRRVDGESPENEGRGKGRGRGRGRGRGDWRGGKTDSGWRGRGRGGSTTAHARPETGTGATPAHGRGEGDDPAHPPSDEELSDSGSDMDPVKDAVSSKAPNTESDPRILKDLGDASQQIIHDDDPPVDEFFASSRGPSNQGRPPRRQRPAQPTALPPNPFASRPSLLRSLLLPEIRHTISNLSQAIHFLVENDFLEGVELKPGDSDSQRIKVLGSTHVVRSDTSQDVVPDAIQE